jgi:hypothetical protein
MKKSIALCAFALVMALPLVSSASTLTNNFLTSTTGNANDLSVGDTIQFEIVISLDALAFDTVTWQVTGDRVGAAGSTNPAWVGVNNNVTNWEWHYEVSNKVDMGTNGRLQPFPESGLVPTARVTGSYGFYAQGGKTGDTTPTLVGTVTIQADAAGTYLGGAFQQATIDGFLIAGNDQGVTINGGQFTVVPEPGTAVLMLLGLGGLGVMGRKSR